MPSLISQPVRIETPDAPPKTIDVFAGLITSGTDDVSIAVMTSPAGWVEPGQLQQFEEWSIVLRGVLVLDHEGGQLQVSAGQAVRVESGEWVRYRTLPDTGAEYVSVCIPAFSPELLIRDEDPVVNH